LRGEETEGGMFSNDYSKFFELLGDEARGLALKYFRSNLSVVTKEDETSVTIADREIERKLRQMMASRYPSHNQVGKEEGGTIADGVSWVIGSHCDGTKSFVCGAPLFGTLAGVLLDGQPTYGMIEIPALSERLCATDPRMFSGVDAQVPFF
jgi:myo-inositol-1(or 4)-monophosphatase